MLGWVRTGDANGSCGRSGLPKVRLTVIRVTRKSSSERFESCLLMPTRVGPLVVKRTTYLLHRHRLTFCTRSARWCHFIEIPAGISAHGELRLISRLSDSRDESVLSDRSQTIDRCGEALLGGGPRALKARLVL
jgi:hypothetical protein